MESYGISAGQMAGRLGRDVTAPPQPSAVQHAQSNLDGQINALHDCIGTLEERLRSVLAQVPEGKGNPNNVAPIATSVASRIGQSADSVAEATSRLMRLLDRLEV